MTNPRKLNVLYREPQPFMADEMIRAVGGIMEVYLPTQTVVREPRLVVPFVARVYRTGYSLRGDRMIHWKDLQSEPGFQGAANQPEPPIYLVEVWEDYGDDGHIEWEHRGWCYVSVPLESTSTNADWLNIIREEVSDLDD